MSTSSVPPVTSVPTDPVLEHALLHVRPGEEGRFETAITVSPA